MAQPVVRLPDVIRNASAAARALTIGLQAWSLYPPEHPAIGRTRRLRERAVRAASVTGHGA